MKLTCNIDTLTGIKKDFDPFSTEGSKLLRTASCKVVAHYSQEGVVAYIGDKISSQVFLASGYIHKVKKLNKWKQRGKMDDTEWLHLTPLDHPMLVFGERNNVSLFSSARIPTIVQALDKIKFKLGT